ncbi:MAG TPA: DUF2950 domain-containing protein [Usitatibacter sp.]|nr:DUF2950 domain-containing protein [Usitatibacter sp.]
MKTPKYLITATLAGALAAAFAMDIQSADTAAAPAAEAKVAMKQRSFAGPEEAEKALVDAVRASDVNALLAVVGPASSPWLFSGDKVADARDWKAFLAAYDEKHSLDRKGDDRVILDVGKDDWPFPAPIVKSGKHWRFDTEAGREEIINRRVGRNELDTIQTLLAVVDAQREYASSDANGSGFPDYARRFISSPGKKDGLYWPQEEGKPASPLGPLVAEAASEGYTKQPKAGRPTVPYHGYFYRMLTSQGKDAPGGAYDYVVGTRMMGGFGVVAYPANYRVSGVMTFIVSHDGVVYEKDLGAQTAAIGAAMTRFNPDATWRKAEQK